MFRSVAWDWPVCATASPLLEATVGWLPARDAAPASGTSVAEVACWVADSVGAALGSLVVGGVPPPGVVVPTVCDVAVVPLVGADS